MRSAQLIAQLGLKPHPERGFYVETYRAGSSVESASHDGVRAAATGIYFLVTADEPATCLHRLKSDEMFHLYEGGPLDVICLFAEGTSRVHRLGLDLNRGERPQFLVPAGTWFGTQLAPGADYCLVGCTVAPGFEFGDFELAEGPELAERYPELAVRLVPMFRRRTR